MIVEKNKIKLLAPEMWSALASQKVDSFVIAVKVDILFASVIYGKPNLDISVQWDFFFKSV